MKRSYLEWDNVSSYEKLDKTDPGSIRSDQDFPFDLDQRRVLYLFLGRVFVGSIPKHMPKSWNGIYCQRESIDAIHPLGVARRLVWHVRKSTSSNVRFEEDGFLVW